MAATTSQISGDVIDAIRPDLEAFASLWSALRTNYQGTNITKTVARLLHMYQPEDGILAYERLLRTLYVLLEDFDGDGLRLLVSMVPPPKGVPDEMIKDVFHKATGFVRLNAPIFHRNNATVSDGDVNSSSMAKNNDASTDPRVSIGNSGTPRLQTVLSNAENLPEGTTILRAIVKSEAPTKTTKSPKVRPRDGDVFRGFPSNEVTNTQGHVRNTTLISGPATNYGGYSQNQRYVDFRELQGQTVGSISQSGTDPNGYRLKWLETPMLVRKNNYNGSSGYPDLIIKTSDNKYIRLPITKLNGPPIGGFNAHYNAPIQTAYQAYYPNSQINSKTNHVNVNSVATDSSTKVRRDLRSKETFDTEKSDELIDRNDDDEIVKPRIAHVDHDYGFARFDDCSVRKENFKTDNLGSPNRETMEKFRDTVKNSQRAIQEDIYRMDVVRCDEDNVENSSQQIKNVDVEIFTPTEELKKGARDFLKRAGNEISSKPHPFPRTRILQDSKYYSSARFESSSRIFKLEKSTKYFENFGKSNDSNDNFMDETVDRCCDENRISSTNFGSTIDTNVGRECRGKIARNQGALKLERTSHVMANDLRISGNKNCDGRLSFGGNADNTGLGRISEEAVESTMRSNEIIHRTNSVSDVVNYRKQYYDALLSIQRAKVAVANSLGISSSQNGTSYDPRVFQYLHQQHHLLQRQQRILMGPHHPSTRQTIVQPGQFANMRDAPGLWIRGSNDWKCPSYGQYAFPHQAYAMTSSSSCPTQTAVNAENDSSLSQKSFIRNPHHSHSRSSRPAVKRRKLEDIVGKLKDTDVDN